LLCIVMAIRCQCITTFWIWSWNPWYGSIPHCMQRRTSDNCELGEGGGWSHLGHSLDDSCWFHTAGCAVTAILHHVPVLLTQGMLLLLGCILLTPPLPYWTLGIANVPHHHTALLDRVTCLAY
jgi:hypothetical protein